MLRAVFVVFTLFTTTISFCQSRTEPAKAEINILKKSSRLTSATGWCKNDISNKWIDHKNYISDYDGRSDAALYENFVFIQFIKFESGGKIYYAITSNEKTGDYTYPNLREGWYPEKQFKWAIFSEEDYQDFKSKLAKFDAQDNILRSKYNGSFTTAVGFFNGATDSKLIELFSSALSKDNQFATYAFQANSQKVDGKSVVRFRSLRNCTDSTLNNDADNLTNKYFEVNSEDFLALLP